MKKKPKKKPEMTTEDRLYQEMIEAEALVEAYEKDNLIEIFNTEKMPANPPQAELLEAWTERKYKIFTYTGSNRLGKTTILSVVCISLMAGKWLWSGEKIWFPHSHSRKLRIVGQDWEKHVKTVLTPELRKWWPANRPVKIKKNQVGAEALWTDLITGSTLEIVSNKQEAELHEGWYGDFIGYDEPPKRDIRVANSRGLIDRLGRELFCMTLLKEAWVDREIIKARNEDGSPDRTVFNVHGVISDNIGYGITEEGVEQYAKALTEDQKKARLDGIPSYMQGLIYPQFKREVHLKPRFVIPTHWVVDIAIDIHPRVRQAVLFMATNPQGLRYLIDEIWEYGDGTWLGDEIVRRINRGAYRINRIVIDPLSKGDANQEGGTTFSKIANVLARHDLVLGVASKDKASGFLEVKTNLKSPNDEPTLFIFDDLTVTTMEIEGYMYLDKGENKGKPMDKDDHFMENLYRLCLLNTQYSSPEEDNVQEWQGPTSTGRYTV